MSENGRPSFVAYRSCSDEYQVYFFGGPLDGSQILTDIFPDSDSLIHRVGSRLYVYRYRQVDKTVFHAHLVGFELPAKPTDQPSGFFARLIHSLAAKMFGRSP